MHKSRLCLQAVEELLRAAAALDDLRSVVDSVALKYQQMGEPVAVADCALRTLDALVGRGLTDSHHPLPYETPEGG